MNIFYIKLFISVLALTGFFIARFIFIKKQAQKPLICPLRFKCDKVVNSKYSTLFGFSVEKLGMFYYLFIFTFYLILSIFNFFVLPNLLILILVFISFGSFIFSVYLVFVQIVILKEGCFWCFISAIISILIFFYVALSLLYFE